MGPDLEGPEPPDGFVRCRRCGKRKGTINWTGDGGVLAFVHGMSQLWCEICCLEVQLKYQKEQAAKIPETQAKLLQLLQEEELCQPVSTTARSSETPEKPSSSS